jgi:spore germination protein YaaH
MLLTKDGEELLELLKKTFPEKSITIGYISGDAEAQSLANQLFRLLLSTNFLEDKILGAHIMATGGKPPTGIILLTSDPNNVSNRDRELYNFFDKRGLSPNFMKATPHEALQIIVAQKPL